MCADTVNLDTVEIINRMLTVAGYKQMKQLADDIGVSSQALTQIKTRRSIALPVLLEFAAKHSVSLDYLVFGKVSEGNGSEEKKIFTSLPVAEYSSTDNDFLLYSTLWLAEEFPNRKSLSQIIIGPNVYVVDLDDRVVDSGQFVFGRDIENVNAITTLKKRLDGRFNVANEQEPMTVEQLTAIGIVGRVIWSGKSQLPGSY